MADHGTLSQVGDVLGPADASAETQLGESHTAGGKGYAPQAAAHVGPGGRSTLAATSSPSNVLVVAAASNWHTLMHTSAFVLRSLALSCVALTLGSVRLCAQTGGSSVEQSPAMQQPGVAVQRTDLPPSSIYEQVLAPFDQVHADMANWSDAEMAAYQATTTAARQECVRIEQTAHEGDEELALARLCTLGHDWDGAFSASRWYTRRNAPPEFQAHLATGFALMIQSDLNMQRVAYAVEHLTEMNERMPLTGETSAIYRFTINALEVTQLPSAIEAAQLEHAALLKTIAQPAGDKGSLAPGQAETDAWHALALLHAASQTGEEEAMRTQLLQAIAQHPPLPVNDAYTAQQGRIAYEWLGKPLPPIADVPKSTRPGLRTATVPPGPGLLVIQREDAADVPALTAGIDSMRKRMPTGPFTTLVLMRPAQPPKTATPSKPPVAATATIITMQNLFETFAAVNGPLFVLRDAQGRIAFLGSGSAAWLNPMAHAESLLARVTPQPEAPDTTPKQAAR